MRSEDNAVRLRSIYASSFGESPDGGAEAQSGVPVASGGLPPTCNNGVANLGDDGDDYNKGSAVETFQEPFRLPESTHCLLFTQRVFSFPFIFSVGVLLLSFACLSVALVNVMDSADNQFDIPVNVRFEVRVAQYLAVFVALLMEEEIPTGLHLLRVIPRASFERNFPGKKCSKFALSALIRLFLGYTFLLSVFFVLAKATEVIEIFYDVLALQFVQQLDDIAFTLAKMDVLGKHIQRACTDKCFQTQVEKEKFGRSKRMSIFLKAIYFVNLGTLLAGMAVVTTRQISGYYQCGSITVDFGNDVWEDALVNMPKEQYEKWVSLNPFFSDQVTPDQYEEWTLVFSYFNGVYEKMNETHAGRPVYQERRKSDRTPYEYVVVPAEIKYCPGISAWVFTHLHIRKSKNDDEVGCNWLLRSPETTEFDLLNVDNEWKIWIGVIGQTRVSFACNACHDESECNMNGQCENGKCECNTEDGIQYLGTHFEAKLKDSCKTIIG